MKTRQVIFRQQLKMSLIGLPLEVREMIYKSVLVQPLQPVLMVKKLPPTARKRRYKKKIPLSPKQQPVFVSSKSILAVCHKFHDEAYRLYYRRNHFLCYATARRAEQFLRSLGPRCRHEIMKLTIVVTSLASNCLSASLCNLLKGCIKLSSLQLHYEGWKAAYQLNGITRLLELHGMTTASVTRKRARASYSEQFQQDAPPPFPNADRCVEMQEQIAYRLRAAWLSPRSICSKCDGIGHAC